MFTHGRDAENGVELSIDAARRGPAEGTCQEALLPVNIPYSRREAPFLGGWLKATFTSFIVAYPYYAVVSELEGLDLSDFTPCNESPCHYMKIFDSGDIPGTGIDIIQLQNGEYRPLMMQDLQFRPHTVLFGNSSGTAEEVEAMLEDHHDLSARYDNETAKMASVTLQRRLAFWLTKLPMRATLFPVELLSRSSEKYFGRFGMHHVVPARCPNTTSAEMLEICSSTDMKSRIHNGLSEAKSRWPYLVGLACWALCRSLHDLLLLAGAQEACTLLFRQVGMFFQGMATFALFFWLSGGSAVFGAPVPNTDEPCMCYYQLPFAAAAFAMATPFALLLVFVSGCQMAGMAALYGDYLHCSTFTVPFYLVRQSKMWTWSTLVGPWVAGTPPYEGERTATLKNRQQRDVEHRDLSLTTGFYRLAYSLQWWLVGLRNVVLLLPVALAAGPAILRYEELMHDAVRSTRHQGDVQLMLMKLVMVLPSVFTVCYALFKLHGMANFFIEYYEEVIDTRLPEHPFIKVLFGKTAFKYLVIKPYNLLVLVICLAVAYGLMPELEWLSPWSNKKAPKPSLVQAETWGACGFMFVVVPLQLLLVEVYSCHEDLIKLLNLSEPSELVARTTSGAGPGKLERAEDHDMDGMRNVVDEFGVTFFHGTGKYHRRFQPTDLEP